MTRGRLTNEAFVVVHREQTAADVVTESLTRTWIDRPAVARRAELAEAPRLHTDRQHYDRTLAPHVLPQLLERAHDIDRGVARQRSELDTTSRELDNIKRRRAGLERTIRDYEARIAGARSVLADHDRPLHRRRHRYELEGARAQLGWTPAALREARGQLVALEASEAQTREQLIRAQSRVLT